MPRSVETSILVLPLRHKTPTLILRGKRRISGVIYLKVLGGEEPHD